LFGGSMVVVFVLGLCVSALMERRAELASVFNNRKTVIEGIEARNEVFKSDFPREYQTWTETAKTDFQSEFNGNVAVDVLEQRPEMVVLWAGYAFSKDYSTPRGHMHAIEDITATLRTGAPATATDGPQPSTCWTCKSPDVPRMMEAIGVDAFYNNKWGALGDEIVNPIGCADCHEPENMNLHISRPALIEAFERQGKDITKATPQEMRSLVCAQCHVEYYFNFPWEGGTSIEAIEAYYNEYGFSDWTHPDSGAQMIKMQHPDYELFSAGSTHFNAGVACADCHMPYTRDGSVKFSTHNVHSPLLTAPSTCGACHTDTDYVIGRVKAIQDQVWATMSLAEDALVAAIAQIKTSAETDGADAALIDEARQLHRSAQLRWDFIAAENSMGFHNPEEALRILASSTDLARQAQLKALEALP